VPIVTTSIGAAGLLLRDGVHAFIRNEPHEFAAGVLRLLCDINVACDMSQALGQLYEQEYSKPIVFNNLDKLFQLD
jgi:hypothetical protein